MMKKRIQNTWAMLAGLFFLASFISIAQAAVPVVNLPSLSPMLEKTMPAIVNVSIQGELPASIVEDKKGNVTQRKARKFQSLGSGVIVDAKKGYIITNAHVIDNAKTVTVTLYNGSRLDAKILGADEDSDVAVLQIKAEQLPEIMIGNSDQLNVGDFVVAVGNPFGLNNFGNSQTATFGIISALQRSELNIDGIENFIQTDAAINMGSSGGALLNMKGQLIGISTAILAPHYAGNVGIGFAIPSNMAVDIAKQIIQFGSIRRGLVGIYVQPMTPELASAFNLSPQTKGGLVSQVNPDSPAEKAGLKAGDVITQINQTKITDASQVKNIIGLLRVDSTVKIAIVRNGNPMTLTATVTDAKKQQKERETDNPYLYGIAMRDIIQQSPIHGRVAGIHVIAVAESSAGWRAGLRPGDVIVDVNHKPVEHLNDLEKIASDSDGQLLVHVLRGPASFFLIIK